MLLPNGKVLVAAGSYGGVLLASAELYDSVSGVWSETGSLFAARTTHTATLLPNGTVLVVGGYTEKAVYLASAELYDPSTGRWLDTARLNTGRWEHTAALLLDGSVLVAGGQDVHKRAVTSSELYLSLDER
jgi:hypothetical protein